MKIVFAKCKTAKIFRLRRATNAKTTINMNKRHIYYLNVVFSARRRRKILGVFLPYKKPPPLVSAHSKKISSIRYFVLKLYGISKISSHQIHFFEQKRTGIERFRNSSDDPENLITKYSVWKKLWRIKICPSSTYFPNINSYPWVKPPPLFQIGEKQGGGGLTQRSKYPKNFRRLRRAERQCIVSLLSRILISITFIENYRLKIDLELAYHSERS